MKRSGSFSDSASKRAYPMEMGLTPTGIDTDILALNDDCLFEVFQYLDWWDLGVVSDVCNRLRHTARAYFAHNKKDVLDLREVYSLNKNVTLNQLILKASKFLRNFGEFIVRVKAGARSYYEHPRNIYSRAIIELLVRYLNQTLTELDLYWVDLDNDLMPSMGPLFQQLHKLSLNDCVNKGVYLDMWPLWTAELRELRWKFLSSQNWDHFHFFHRQFPKLTKISFYNISHLTIDDIAEMIKYNPQLKEVEIRNCERDNRTPLDTIVPAIAQHIPGIESLSLEWRNDISANPITVRYFAHLKKLRSLTLRLVHGDRSPESPYARKITRKYIVPVLKAIGAADIPLKYLNLATLKFNSDNEAQTFVDAITTFKQLETLEFYPLDGFKPSHFIGIGKHCNELSALHIAGGIFGRPTSDDILEIIPHFAKLQELSILTVSSLFGSQLFIDLQIFERLIKIVENRGRYLALRLYPHFYTINVPSDLLRAHQKSLLIDCSYEFFDF